MTLPERYTGPAIVLHWLIAALIIISFGFGKLYDAFGDDNIRFMIDTHKSLGITVLALVIMRILWRLTHKPPPLPPHYKPWERRASHFAHIGLYVLIFALPISGWLHDSAWKAAPEIKMYWFGLFELPRVSFIMNMEPEAKEVLHGQLNWFHETFGYALLILFILHVGGALKHQFIDKYPEMQRMWK